MSFSKFISSCFNASSSVHFHIFQHRSCFSSSSSLKSPILPSVFFLYNTTRTFYSTPSYPPKDIYSSILSLCNSKSIKEGIHIHSPITKLGLEHELYLTNNLITLYSKCFSIKHARQLFEEISPYGDVVSWTSIISAYTKAGHHEEALSLFDQMLGSGLIPNEFTFSSVVRSCCYRYDDDRFEHGIRIHGQIMKLGFESNPVLASALIDLYSRCGCISEACRIFDTIVTGDTISWTTMVSCFVQGQEWVRALRYYVKMIEAGVVPNEFTYVKVLMACSYLGLKYGKLVHAHCIMLGIRLNVVLKTSLIDMYSKCQRTEDALKVSKQTPESDVMLWTVLINGYTQGSDFDGAISAFREMELAGVLPNAFTYAGIISSICGLELGRQFHSRVIRYGLEWDVSVGNGLVAMYTKCSSTVGDALEAFQEIMSPDVISWTSLIDGFAQHGMKHEAYQAFVEMQVSGVQPNLITMTSILNGCGTKESSSPARKVHAYIIKIGAESDMTIGNALVNTYAKMGIVKDAWNIIKMMKIKDVVTYTSLAVGINQLGLHGETLGLIADMTAGGVKMDGFSVATFLSASAGLAALELGKQLHCHSIKSYLCSWISVSNGLVDMYGKCGSVEDAQRVFMEIPEPNVVSWNGLISGFASNGNVSTALSRLEDMIMAGIQPDEITFLIVLYACSHGGLVEKGVEYFYSMSDTYAVVPQYDHYVCLVDLLGRAGRLQEALHAIEEMPFRPDALVYKTLLASCKVHRNVVLGEDMARRALELDSLDTSVYVLLASIYDDAGMSDFAEMTRKMMREKELWKNPGQSWMETSPSLHRREIAI